MKTRRTQTGAHRGIRRHGNGWQAFIRVGGQFYSQQFPLMTSRREMQQWRQMKRAEVIAALPKPALPPPVIVTAADEQAMRDEIAQITSTLSGEGLRLLLMWAHHNAELDRRANK